MKLAIFCNNFRGVELVKFLKDKYEIKLVFIAKKNLDKSILKYFKNKFDFKIVNNVNLLNVYNLIKKNTIDVNVIAGFPYIFKDNIINSSKFGTINLHAGKLPKYRGGSPLNWQIINNEKKIGLSIIKITKKLDKGPLLSRISFSIKKTDNINIIKQKSYKYFKKIVIKSINNLINNKFIVLNYNKGNYFKQRNKKDSEIFFKKMTDVQVFNLVRASSYPYYSYYKKNNKKFFLKKVQISTVKLFEKPGSIINKKNFVLIKCKKGSIKVLR